MRWARYPASVQELTLETARTSIREPRDEELPTLLAVLTSHPDYLEWTEGSGDEAGRYDLSMLERDLGIAAMTPGRHSLGVFEKESGDGVGVVDFLEEHPERGMPWIGLIAVR